MSGVFLWEKESSRRRIALGVPQFRFSSSTEKSLEISIKTFFYLDKRYYICTITNQNSINMAKQLTPRGKAYDIMETLTNDDNGYTHQQILEHLIGNVLSGSEALEAMNACIEEFPSPDFPIEEEDEA